MTCPFLNETQVKYCRRAPVRKLIPLVPAGRAEEKCSSAEYVTCSVYRAEAHQAETAATCPFLHESLMQYCGAAPVARLVPYSESLLSRCGTDSFRYCELYLSMAHPDVESDNVDGIPVPGWLRYSANHMWLDVTDDGVCHVGIDAFLARTLGRVERIGYIWEKGRHCPAAVLTVAGRDLEVVFPNPMLLTGCNLYLRSNPVRLTDEPYTGGWLFEGTPLPETQQDLLQGAASRDWMEREERRINEFLQQSAGECQACPADGGLFAAGVTAGLDPERMRRLFHEFFSPLTNP